MDPSFYICKKCPQFCSKCFFSPDFNQAECNECSSNIYFLTPNRPKVCEDVCGDFLAIRFPCDNNKKVNFDGCD